MRIMRTAAVLLMVLMAITVVITGCGEKQKVETDDSNIVARVNDWTLTSTQLDNIIDKLPENQKTKYSTPEGRAEFVSLMIEEELYHQAGLERHLEDEAGVQKKIDDATRRIIISEYFARYVNERAIPTDEEMHDYYESHKDKFTTQAVLRAQHIFSKDRDKLVELKKRIENGEKMTTLAHKYSEDELTKKDGGDLGYFNPGGYVRFIGYSKKWSDAVFALEKGVVSDPIEFEKGYSIVRVNRTKPATLKPYEDVKDDIEQIISTQRIDQVRKDVVAELSQDNTVVNVLQRELDKIQRTPEELWNLAQTSTDSHRRLKVYNEIVEKFPESDYAPQALFMMGFVYAEELKDQYNADQVFSRVVKEYPGTDIAKSAKWMLQNMGKPMPDFEDLDDLNKKISEGQ